MINQLAVSAIRILSADAVQKANSGHPGLPLGAAPIAYELWANQMKHNPKTTYSNNVFQQTFVNSRTFWKIFYSNRRHTFGQLESFVLFVISLFATLHFGCKYGNTIIIGCNFKKTRHKITVIGE